MIEAGSRATRCVGIVLAAGRSTRTGFPKALADLDGESFVARTVRVLTEAGCDEVVVVVAAPHDDAIVRSLSNVHVARNPDPDRGMLSSLQVGIRAALALGAAPDHVVFALVDHPRVRPETVRALLARARETRAPRVRPIQDGRGGHPVVLSGALARELSSTPARTVREALRALGPGLDLEVSDPAVLDDTDTEESIRALGGRPGPA